MRIFLYKVSKIGNLEIIKINYFGGMRNVKIFMGFQIRYTVHNLAYNYLRNKGQGLDKEKDLRVYVGS